MKNTRTLEQKIADKNIGNMTYQICIQCRQQRIEAKVSAKDMAAKLEWDLAHVYSFERGVRNVTLFSINAYLNALEKKLSISNK